MKDQALHLVKMYLIFYILFNTLEFFFLITLKVPITTVSL